jgi:hypothetical protein
MQLELPSLSSRDVDQFLVNFHGVSDDERAGYVQRLRSITRLGFPAGVSAGKGHPARYNANQFFQLLAVTELYRCHVPPLQAVELVDTSWKAMKASILAVWDSVDAAERSELKVEAKQFWRIPAEGGQRQTRAGEANLPEGERVTVITREAIDDLIDGDDLRSHCHIFIDVSKLIRGVFYLLKFSGDSLSSDQIACFMGGMERG